MAYLYAGQPAFAIKKAMDDTEIRDFPPFARMIIADADLGGCENEIMTGFAGTKRN